MAYLAQGVAVPDQHLETGVVSNNLKNELSDGIISDLFQVKVQKKETQSGRFGGRI
jgi:hypothetical protein